MQKKIKNVNNVTKLKQVNKVSKPSLKQELVQSAIYIADNFEGDVHAYAIVAVRNNAAQL